METKSFGLGDDVHEFIAGYVGAARHARDVRIKHGRRAGEISAASLRPSRRPLLAEL